MKNIVKIIIGMILALLVSCGNSSEELQKIKELHEQANNSLASGGSSDEIIEITADYLVAVVRYAQIRQKKDSSKIDIDIMQEAKSLAEDVVDKYSAASDNLVYRLNEGSVSMLSGAYYNTVGEVSDAVLLVGDGVQILDDVVKRHPENAYARGYRAVNFSSLPDLFGKKEIAAEDFSFALDYLEKNTVTNETELGFFKSMISRVETFFEEEQQEDKLLQVERVKSKLGIE